MASNVVFGKFYVHIHYSINLINCPKRHTLFNDKKINKHCLPKKTCHIIQSTKFENYSRSKVSFSSRLRAFCIFVSTYFFIVSVKHALYVFTTCKVIHANTYADIKLMHHQFPQAFYILSALSIYFVIPYCFPPFFMPPYLNRCRYIHE